MHYIEDDLGETGDAWIAGYVARGLDAAAARANAEWLMDQACPACEDGYVCRHGDGCIVKEALDPAD